MKVVLLLAKHVPMNVSTALISARGTLVWNNVKKRVGNVLTSVADAQKNAGRALLMLRKLYRSALMPAANVPRSAKGILQNIVKGVQKNAGGVKQSVERCMLNKLNNFQLFLYQFNNLKSIIMKQVLSIGLVLLSFAFVFTACNDDKSKEGSTTNNESKTSETLAQNEMYTCTMHNEVMSSKPGTCPKCDMKLTKQKMTAEQEKMMKEGTYVKSKEEQ